MSKLWAPAQHQIYLALGKKNTGLRWVSQLIRKLLDMAWDQWEHRCGIATGKETTARHLRINRAVEEVLTAGPGNLVGRDRRLFLHPARIRALPPSKKEGWLANVDAAFRRREYREEQRRHSLRSERSVMRAWLATA